jgi:hypothetical protein
MRSSVPAAAFASPEGHPVLRLSTKNCFRGRSWQAQRSGSGTASANSLPHFSPPAFLGRSAAIKVRGPLARAGHSRSAVIAGASERSIMVQTGHAALMVRGTAGMGASSRENSGGKLGL